MLFNSVDFAIFLVLVFFLYWFVFNRNLKIQNTFVLLCSYVFYGWWDWRFLSLIFLSSLTDYLVGLGLENFSDRARRRWLLYVSLGVNLGLLGFFKYYNFFVDSFVEAFGFLGLQLHRSSLNIILPVGISFYTFQTLSYSIDIYRKKIHATRDFIAFFAFVSFFPQLVAGPIERAAHLLPQFQRPRRFDYDHARDGLRQMLWGLCKKVVVADTCAKHVDYIFGHFASLNGSTLLLGTLLFSFQIYGDFSGYSDMAIGMARLLGFDLMKNFALPYFSRDIREFWRRWHISLSTWFRDYVYIPLGGNRGGKAMRIRNSLVTFTVSGFWHGANWTFIIWGFLNGLYYLPEIIFGIPPKKGIVAEHRLLPSWRELLQVSFVFWLITLTWVFFRSPDIHEAFGYLGRIFSSTLFADPHVGAMSDVLAIVIVFSGIEWLQRRRAHALQLDGIPVGLRWLCYYVLIFCVIHYYKEAKTFIYFQF